MRQFVSALCPVHVLQAQYKWATELARTKVTLRCTVVPCLDGQHRDQQVSSAVRPLGSRTCVPQIFWSLPELQDHLQRSLGERLSSTARGWEDHQSVKSSTAQTVAGQNPVPWRRLVINELPPGSRSSPAWLPSCRNRPGGLRGNSRAPRQPLGVGSLIICSRHFSLSGRWRVASQVSLGTQCFGKHSAASSSSSSWVGGYPLWVFSQRGKLKCSP